MVLKIRFAEDVEEEQMSSVYIDAFEFKRDLNDIKRNFKIYQRLNEINRGGCLVAEHEGTIIATGCYVDYESYTWIGSVAVASKFQRKGVGTVLMLKLLDMLKGRAKSFGLDATSAGERLYKKLGFIGEYRTTVFRLPEERSNIFNIKYKVKEVENLPEWILKLDEEASGGKRSHVLKTFIENGSRLLIVHGKGYALLRGNRIGPLIAKNAKIAKAIIVKAIELGAKRLIVPEANEEAIKLMKEIGAQKRYSCLRMRLGKRRKERISFVYSIISYAKG